MTKQLLAIQAATHACTSVTAGARDHGGSAPPTILMASPARYFVVVSRVVLRLLAMFSGHRGLYVTLRNESGRYETTLSLSTVREFEPVRRC